MPGPPLKLIIERSGEPKPWFTVYNGIKYLGEVVSNDGWEPRWGQSLDGDSFFRIVFLNAAPDDPTFGLRDSRTEGCLPGTSLDLDAGPSGQGIRSIREARTAYATPSNSGVGIAGASDEIEFYNMCLRRAASPARLGEVAGRVRELSPLAAESSKYQLYLESVPVTPASGELLLMREALQAQLALEQLMDAPTWRPALCEQGEGFIRSYMTQYRAHHLEYHRRMDVLREGLDRALPRVGALERLNALSAAGTAVNPELPEGYRALVGGIEPCAVAFDDIDLDVQPICEACDLNTWDGPPKAEVEDCLHQLDLALETQMSRLCEKLVGLCWMILARRRWIGFFVSSAPPMSMPSPMS